MKYSPIYYTVLREISSEQRDTLPDQTHGILQEIYSQRSKQ